jgi:hypothetical protein
MLRFRAPAVRAARADRRAASSRSGRGAKLPGTDSRRTPAPARALPGGDRRVGAPADDGVALRLRDGRRLDAQLAAEVLARIGVLVDACSIDLWVTGTCS